MKVWVVNCGDTGCDEDWFVAIAGVFATKEAAQACMSTSVKDDEESFEVTAVWNDGMTMAVIDAGFGRRIVFTMKETEVQNG